MRKIETSSPSATADVRIGTTKGAAKEEADGATPMRPPRGAKRAAMAVGLIDAKPLRRQGLANLLSGGGSEITVVEAADAGALLAAGAHASLATGAAGGIELVLLCIGGVDIDDRWVQQQLDALVQRAPGLPLILLSDRESIADVARALMSGIRGYIPTSVDTRVALEVLRLVRAGGTFVPAQALLRSFQGAPSTATGDDADSADATLPPPDLSLTRRQMEVLRLVCHGKPNKVIAHALHLEESTVKVHMRDIMRKLKTENRTQLALLATRLFADDGAEPVPAHGIGVSKRTGSDTPTK